MDNTNLRNGAMQAAIFGDRIILLAIGLSAVASFILGFQFIDKGLAIGATLALLVAFGRRVVESVQYSGGK